MHSLGSPVTCRNTGVSLPLCLTTTGPPSPNKGTHSAASPSAPLLPLQLDSSLAAVMQQYQEHKRRRTILAAFSDNPSGTVQAIINAQAKELRISSGKEGDLAEVMSPGEVFKERWVEDAVLKYLSKKQAAGMAQRQMAQVVAMQTAAMAQTMAMQTAMQQAAAAAAAQGAGPSTNVAAAGAPVIVATPPAQVLQPAAVPPQPAAP